jgi:hypothetical protein
MATQSKRRTITLTGRAPVTILEADWPVIASARGDSYSGNDYGRHQQALAQGEVDTYSLRVRQHAEGRTLVYGVLDAAIPEWHAPAGGESRRGGVLLRTGEGVAEAIRQVGEECRLPESIIRECIASLPAEEL